MGLEEFCASGDPVPRHDAERAGRVGHAPLEERILDLLADILFATDAIREMVAVEPAAVPFEGLDATLNRVYREVRSAMSEVEARSVP